MLNIKQSIVAQRQIPEHIRENYPLFVEFIKSYYDFLQQTQGQNLEQIRDVDTTLDEFIDRFKSELAKNFPIHLASDKALILKHLREFYLSRGSEDSFKFLFNVLFNKEAELFYPSTQMLRASDGKWHQDVSIFVKPDDLANVPNIKDIVGKFIIIVNDKGKHIHTYIENVVEYSSTIYEVFIHRDYANEINIGAKVSTEDGKYSGTVQQCPSNVKIYKPGKGFKVGEIYALRTQLGRGCVIKVTKVDSDGGIKAIKVIQFGLDYKTKFYSYLSSKDVIGFEYVQPAQLNHPYNPNEPHYNENSGGFMDHGWASKQTYFYYDSTISIQPELDPSRASDRYFADPAYVGEVVEQFYADTSVNPIDEDLAIIEVNLGAVAKYPGYYLSADGFISDQIYIQDGNYYQAFSYVIKVEEELRRYANIIKALIHPAGMKVFSEYKIFNILKVSAVSRKISRVFQLPTKDNMPSVTTPTDRGFSYNNYTTEFYVDQPIDIPSVIINAGYITYPSPISGIEYPGSSGVIESRPGQTAKHSGKSINTYQNVSDFKYALLERQLTDAITERFTQIESSDPDYTIIRNYNETYSNILSKPIVDTINTYIETFVKAYSKDIADNVLLSEMRSSAIETIKNDVILFVDSYTNLTSKPVEDLISNIVDENVRIMTKAFTESITGIEDVNRLIEKGTFADTFNVNDIISNNLEKIIEDSIALSDYIQFIRALLFDDLISLAEDYSSSLTKVSVDTQTISDDSSLRSLENAKADSINIDTNGRIILNSYGQEMYFALLEDYQPSLAIT